MKIMTYNSFIVIFWRIFSSKAEEPHAEIQVHDKASSVAKFI